MKFTYKNSKAVGPVVIYNGLTAQDGDIVDATDWHKDLIAKALKNPHFEPLKEIPEAEVTAPKRGRPAKIRPNDEVF